jgi:hypothetical protein
MAAKSDPLFTFVGFFHIPSYHKGMNPRLVNVRRTFTPMT